MSDIKYEKGDATNPDAPGNKMIVHICNDQGKWGKGFVMALSKKWDKPEKEYREWYDSGKDFDLGAVQFVEVEDEDDIWVANLIGQHKTKKDDEGNPPIRYQAVDAGLVKVQQKAKELSATVHMPRIGTGLAGGKWEKIEPMIKQRLTDQGVEVVVYDYNGK